MADFSIPKEFSSIDRCFTGIPLQVRRGLSIVNSQFTCIDAVEQFIAIGTNLGVVYWCNRKTNKIERLRPEKSGGPVTFVKIVSSVDYMVAFGDNKGIVSIFIIPKEKPIFSSENSTKKTFASPVDQSLPSKNMVERFTAAGIHSASITAAEWSLNGQKLFTGDEKGIICYTQMDFGLNIIKSTEILNEKFPIVQLSYSQPNLLLIASEYRCVIYNQSANSQVQVGQKERSNACKLGAVIGSHSSLQGPVIYAARPKQRIWLANTTGQVQKTLLFNEALAREYPKIELLKFSAHQEQLFSKYSENSTSIENIQSNVDFNCFKLYLGKLVVVHDMKNLIILNPETTSIVGGLHLKKIVSVTTYKDEIFILEGCRRIRRLALTADPFVASRTNDIRDLPDSPMELFLGIVGKIKEEASQNVVKPLLENLKKMENNLLEDRISPAEEAINLNLKTEKKSRSTSAAIGNYGLSTSAVNENYGLSTSTVNENYGLSTSAVNENYGLSTSAVNENYGPLISVERKPNSVGRSEKHSEISSIADNSAVGTKEEVHSEQVTEKQSTTLCIPLEDIPQDIAPDMRTPDSLMKALEDTEQKLGRLLNLNMNSQPKVTEITQLVNTESSRELHEEPRVNPVSEETREFHEESSRVNPVSEESNIKTDAAETDVSSVFEMSTNEEENSPTIDESNENIFSPDTDIDEVQNCCECSWKQLNLPFSPKWICITNSNIYIGESKLAVYAYDRRNRKLRWSKQKFRALRMAVSLNENIFWKLDPKGAHTYVHDSDEWMVISRAVNSIGVNDTAAWYICKGKIYVQLGLNRKKPFSDESLNVECPVNVSKICVFKEAVWILSDLGLIFSRNGITDNNPVGSSWKKLVHPDNVVVSDISVTCRNSGWIVDKRNEFFFTDNFAEENVTWWQVIVGQHVYGNETSLSDQLSKFVSWSKESSSIALVGSDETSLWIVNAGENSVYINKTAVLGHRWIPLGAEKYFKTKWKFINACGSNDDTSVLWCVNSNNDIFLYKKSTEVFRAIEAPTTEEIACVSSVGNSFWVLLDDGQVFSRAGISDSNPFGCFWEELIMSPDPSNSVTFKLLTCSTDIVWGIGCNNEIYATSKDPTFIAEDTGRAHWVHVKDLTPRDAKIIDIVVGHNKCMVWAIDSKYNVYVRQAVFDDFPFGTEWVIVPGIKAVNLTISGSAVWALTADGNIYRRFGISATNFIGDYWMQVPGLLTQICASPSEVLWGISKIQGRLQRYERHILGISDEYVDRRRFSENLEDEWEIIS